MSQFASATPGLSLSGETATGSLGMDHERGRLLTGFAMTHSLGEGTAHGAGLPYVCYALSERLSFWGLAGTGSGQLTLDLDGATTRATRRPGRASSSAPVSATRTRRGASIWR